MVNNKIAKAMPHSVSELCGLFGVEYKPDEMKVTKSNLAKAIIDITK